MNQPASASDRSDGAPLNVLLWSPLGSSESYHGPGSFAYRLYSSAPLRDLQVTLAHGNPRQPTTGLYAQEHFVAHYRTDVVGLLRFLYRSRRWLKQNLGEYDVMHGLCGYHATMSPAYYAHQRGLPVVIFVAMHKDEFIDKPGIKTVLGLPKRRREMLRQVDGVIAMSRAIYEEISGYGVSPRRIARIPMGVNTTRFQPCFDIQAKASLRAELGLAHRPTLMFVGALVRRKRPDLLIQSLAKVVQRNLDCQLVLAGPPSEPEYAREMREQVEQLGLAERVVWVDHTPRIEQYLRAGDLLALPSSEEGMPAAIVEAMSAGLPCLGTPISGINDLITDCVTGRIIRQDPDHIADAIAEYLENPAMMINHGKNARSEVLRLYSCEVVLNAYRDMFRRVKAGQDACDASTLPEFAN